jgi:hypothetical protein
VPQAALNQLSGKKASAPPESGNGTEVDENCCMSWRLLALEDGFRNVHERNMILSVHFGQRWAM